MSVATERGAAELWPGSGARAGPSRHPERPRHRPEDDGPLCRRHEGLCGDTPGRSGLLAGPGPSGYAPGAAGSVRRGRPRVHLGNPLRASRSYSPFARTASAASWTIGRPLGVHGAEGAVPRNPDGITSPGPAAPETLTRGCPCHRFDLPRDHRPAIQVLGCRGELDCPRNPLLRRECFDLAPDPRISSLLPGNFRGAASISGRGFRSCQTPPGCPSGPGGSESPPRPRFRRRSRTGKSSSLGR